MFRFYCSTCKSVKRVQHKPNVIKNESLGNPTDRIGICDAHSRIKQYQLDGIEKLLKNKIPINLEKNIGKSKMNRKR